jgi:multiple sugar transport system permease protein
MLPLFLMLQKMGVVDTLLAVIISGARAGVPGVHDPRYAGRAGRAARGRPDRRCLRWRIFWTIVMPLLRPILVTFAAFVFLSTWDDFMWR